jgi:hypothetical protein
MQDSRSPLPIHWRDITTKVQDITTKVNLRSTSGNMENLISFAFVNILYRQWATDAQKWQSDNGKSKCFTSGWTADFVNPASITHQRKRSRDALAKQRRIDSGRVSDSFSNITRLCSQGNNPELRLLQSGSSKTKMPKYNQAAPFGSNAVSVNDEMLL